MRFKWIPTSKNEADIFTKNTDTKTFLTHLKRFDMKDAFEKVPMRKESIEELSSEKFIKKSHTKKFKARGSVETDA